MCWLSSFRWISVRMRQPQWCGGSLSEVEAASVKPRYPQRDEICILMVGLNPKWFLILSGRFLKHAFRGCDYSQLWVQQGYTDSLVQNLSQNLRIKKGGNLWPRIKMRWEVLDLSILIRPTSFNLHFIVLMPSSAAGGQTLKIKMGKK